MRFSFHFNPYYMDKPVTVILWLNEVKEFQSRYNPRDAIKWPLSFQTA